MLTTMKLARTASKSAPANRPLRVGIGSRNYGYRRVCYDLPIKGVEYVKPTYLPWKFLRRGDPRWQNTYCFFPRPRVDLLHLWNGISLNRTTPWLTSFEAHLPRYGTKHDHWLYRIALDRLHGANCRKLLALSDFAKHFFLTHNKGFLDPHLEAKTTVLYGGVNIPDDALARRGNDWCKADEFVVCMVGHAFFQKGGVALLRACRRLRREIPNMRLVIVSRLVHSDFVTKTTEKDRQAALSEIASLPNVEWHEQIPHEDVLELLAHAHVGVLTSLDETFGWSIVEAMSCGLPVVATNVCAMPEIVHHGTNGFQIGLPLQPSRRWSGLQHPAGSQGRRRALAEAMDIIEEGLCRYLRELVENREILRRMSLAAVEHVRRHHDPEMQANRLLAIYEGALNS